MRGVIYTYTAEQKMNFLVGKRQAITGLIHTNRNSGGTLEKAVSLRKRPLLVAHKNMLVCCGTQTTASISRRVFCMDQGTALPA